MMNSCYSENLHTDQVIDNLVSVIIPVFNRTLILEEAVESVLNQSYDLLEIIVVDDGSNSQTQDFIKRLSRRTSKIRYSRIENSGPGPARQHGLNLARGEFIQFLDSDDLLVSNKFELQVEILRRQSSCGVAYSNQGLISEKGEVLESSWKLTGKKFSSMTPTIFSQRIWGTSNPLFRRSALDGVGPWTKLSNFEDWEYDCRIAKSNVELAYVPETLVNNRRHSGDHFGSNIEFSETKASDRCTALELIYQHALDFKLNFDDPHFQIFFRVLFHHTRLFAEWGYPSLAKRMLKLCLTYRGKNKFQRFEFVLFSILVKLFGWKIVGKSVARIK